MKIISEKDTEYRYRCILSGILSTNEKEKIQKIISNIHKSEEDDKEEESKFEKELKDEKFKNK